MSERLRIGNILHEYRDVWLFNGRLGPLDVVAKFCKQDDVGRMEHFQNEVATYERLHKLIPMDRGHHYILSMLRVLQLEDVPVGVGGDQADLFGIVMLKMEGVTLRSFLKKNPGLGPALEVLLQVSVAVAAMHEAQSIHNDLHHKNVMVRRTPDGKPRLHRIVARGGGGDRVMVYELWTAFLATVFDFDWSSRMPPDRDSLPGNERSRECRTSGYCSRNDVYISDEMQMVGPLFGKPEMLPLTLAFVPDRSLHTTNVRWYSLCWPQQPALPAEKHTRPCYRCVPTARQQRTVADVLLDPKGPFSCFAVQQQTTTHAVFSTTLDLHSRRTYGLHTPPPCDPAKLRRALLGGSGIRPPRASSDGGGGGKRRRVAV